ncbi:hypothetical protein K438DRAFT_1901415 [Mycena galopus ATCC 62051]|nr:hypothetical protein K438DRAFT_1901415 [Mycena galopus ATCC 62051]
MSSESPQAKRQRTENVPLTRSARWFSDGNVVLQAANTQFRVHWGVLALHSTVFRDMQGLPQLPDQPNIEGCPVVQLSDNPDDVEHLLQALYTPTFLSRDKLPLPTVSALIRLGRKYNSQDVLDSAVARITSYSPTTLWEYDECSTKTIESYDGLIFDLLAFVNEQKILAALPCLYYVLVTKYILEDLFNGIEREDGTVTSLSPVDLRRCVVGQQRLFAKQFQPNYTFGWVRKWVFDDCTARAQCQRLRDSILQQYMDDTQIEPLYKPDLLGRVHFHFCAACKEHIRQCVTAGRKRIWTELPEIFDLPPWSELKNDI